MYVRFPCPPVIADIIVRANVVGSVLVEAASNFVCSSWL